MKKYKEREKELQKDRVLKERQIQRERVLKRNTHEF